VSQTTIGAFELNKPRSPRLDLDAIRSVLEAGGVEFVAIGGALAVRLKKDPEMKRPTIGLPKTKIEPIDESRLSEDLSHRIDAWIAMQPAPRPSRQEAIRRLLAEALGRAGDAGPIAAESLKR
jgi:hypothetical protein